jgi:tetratricopeptide (TPR) repeat protein
VAPVRLTGLFCSVIALACMPAAWSQIATPDQNAHEHMRLAQQALQSGNPARAGDEFRAVLRTDENNLEANANLGVLEYFAGNWSEAVVYLRAAFKLKPSLWRIEALLGITEKRLGKRQKAEQLLKEAFAHLETSPVRIQAGLELLDILYAEHNMDQAVETVASLQRIAPSNADVLYTAYRIHTDLANQALDVLAETAPESGRMHQLMAQHLINEGSLPQALDQYRKALTADPGLAGLHYELGETILDSSTGEESLKTAGTEFDAAAKENPGDPNPEYQLGRIDSIRDDFAAAQRHYSRALKIQPDHLWAQLGLGQALVKLDQPDAARIDPSNASVHYRLGSLYKQLGRKQDSTRELAEFRKLQQRDEQLQRVFLDMHQRVSREHDRVEEAEPAKE